MALLYQLGTTPMEWERQLPRQDPFEQWCCLVTQWFFCLGMRLARRNCWKCHEIEPLQPHQVYMHYVNCVCLYCGLEDVLSLAWGRQQRILKISCDLHEYPCTHNPTALTGLCVAIISPVAFPIAKLYRK